MASQIDMSLDDVIKMQRSERRAKSSGFQRVKSGRGRGNKNAPYSKSGSHDDEIKDIGKIMISNLHYNVTEKDIKELFAQVGPVRNVTLNFDSNGKSQGTGMLTFSRPSDAVIAVQKYHGVTLDGRAMKLAIPYTPSAHKVPISERVGAPRELPSEKRRGNKGKGDRKRSKKQGRRQDSRSKVTREDLDAELDNMYPTAASTDAPKKEDDK